MLMRTSIFRTLFSMVVTAYAALRPQDGCSAPHQSHMKDTSSNGRRLMSNQRHFHPYLRTISKNITKGHILLYTNVPKEL